VFRGGLVKVVLSNRLGGALGAMVAGADSSVRVLDEQQLLGGALLLEAGPGAGAGAGPPQLGPPLKDAEATMALLEFDCGPAPAARFAPKPAPLLDQMAPLPQLPGLNEIGPVGAAPSAAPVAATAQVRDAHLDLHAYIHSSVLDSLACAQSSIGSLRVLCSLHAAILDIDIIVVVDIAVAAYNGA
jgi:hypothetical protein